MAGQRGTTFVKHCFKAMKIHHTDKRSDGYIVHGPNQPKRMAGKRSTTFVDCCFTAMKINNESSRMNKLFMELISTAGKGGATFVASASQQ
jgi:hypothetical protein